MPWSFTKKKNHARIENSPGAKVTQADTIINKTIVNREAASLALPGLPVGVELIGRKEGLADFARQFFQQEKICVISGIGGVGKTEFVKAYLKENREHWKHIGWFEYKESFRKTLLDEDGLMSNACAPVDDPGARYAEILGLLRKLTNEDVLVFDNVEHIESSEDLKVILSLPCRVVFTTRDSFSALTHQLLIYLMDFLSPKDCVDLFGYYRDKPVDEAERGEVEQIVRLAGQHTLALELLAKTCHAARLSAQELLDRLERDGFNLEGLAEEVTREGRPESEARFMEHSVKETNKAPPKGSTKGPANTSRALENGKLSYSKTL